MRKTNQEGNAIVIAVVISAMIAGLATAFSMISVSEHTTTATSMERERAYHVAEAGIAAAIQELNANLDYDGGGIGTTSGSIDKSTYTVNSVYDAGANEYTLTSTSNCAGALRRIQAVVGRAEIDLNVNARAAITANGNVATLGTISVDGRDWKADNSGLNGPGVDGISSRGTISIGGSSSCGGNGLAPIGGATAANGVFEQNADWADHIDNDADGSIDEETFDGVDNDGDGLTDEDNNNSYPPTPDIAMGLPAGSLEATARAQGTYLTSQAQYDALITANGGNLPGGKVIFLAFDLLIPAEFGPALNEDPSIIVMHNAAGDALMKNLHGQFKGMLLVDDVVHINGDAVILGAIQSFTPATHGNAYGNGSAVVRFSSEVLANLPGVITTNAYFAIRSQREISPQ